VRGGMTILNKKKLFSALDMFEIIQTSLFTKHSLVCDTEHGQTQFTSHTKILKNSVDKHI
jgi:hypothetical protein